MSPDHTNDGANILLFLGNAFTRLPWLATELIGVQAETNAGKPLPALDFLEPLGSGEKEIEVEVPDIVIRLLDRANAAMKRLTRDDESAAYTIGFRSSKSGLLYDLAHNMVYQVLDARLMNSSGFVDIDFRRGGKVVGITAAQQQ